MKKIENEPKINNYAETVKKKNKSQIYYYSTLSNILEKTFSIIVTFQIIIKNITWYNNIRIINIILISNVTYHQSF